MLDEISVTCLLLICVCGLQAQNVKDIDGNLYHAVIIGTQTWLTENLRVTHYSNGESIAYVEDGDKWSRQNNGAYCVFDSSDSNKKTYGLLYNWYAVNDKRNLCPIGWHVPSDEEWTELTKFLGGELTAGAQLKEKGTKHWKGPNSKANNESDFTALPGGFRNYDGIFYDIGYYGFWWTSTKESSGLAWGRGMYYFFGDVDRDKNEVSNGFSVRCLMNK